VEIPIPTAVFGEERKAFRTECEMDEDEQRAHPQVATTGGAGLIIVSGPNPDNETYSVTLKPGAGVWTSAGIEVDTDASLPGGTLRAARIDSFISEVDAAYSRNGRGAARKHLSFSHIVRFRRPRAFRPWRYSMTIPKQASESSVEQNRRC